jgi:hypothetical protein
MVTGTARGHRGWRVQARVQAPGAGGVGFSGEGTRIVAVWSASASRGRNPNDSRRPVDFRPWRRTSGVVLQPVRGRGVRHAHPALGVRGGRRWYRGFSVVSRASCLGCSGLRMGLLAARWRRAGCTGRSCRGGPAPSTRTGVPGVGVPGC